MRLIVSILKYVWALPNTIIGVTLGVLGQATGGKGRRRGPVLEFHGGFVTWLLKTAPQILFRRGGIMAMTFGYSILARSKSDLDRARAHELVHVEQYGRWGPFFLPAYAMSSLVQKLKGNNPYLDNFLEVEAYAREPIHPSGKDQSVT